MYQIKRNAGQQMAFGRLSKHLLSCLICSPPAILACLRISFLLLNESLAGPIKAVISIKTAQSSPGATPAFAASLMLVFPAL